MGLGEASRRERAKRCGRTVPDGWIPFGTYGRLDLSSAVGDETPGEVHSPSAGGGGCRAVCGFEESGNPKRGVVAGVKPGSDDEKRKPDGPGRKRQRSNGMGGTSRHPIDSSLNL